MNRYERPSLTQLIPSEQVKASASKSLQKLEDFET